MCLKVRCKCHLWATREQLLILSTGEIKQAPAEKSALRIRGDGRPADTRPALIDSRCLSEELRPPVIKRDRSCLNPLDNRSRHDSVLNPPEPGNLHGKHKSRKGFREQTRAQSHFRSALGRKSPRRLVRSRILNLRANRVPQLSCGDAAIWLSNYLL